MNNKILIHILSLIIVLPVCGMEVVYRDQTVPVDQRKLDEQAAREFQDLNINPNTSQLFVTELIKNPAFQQAALAREKTQNIQIMSENGHPINMIIVERNSKQVLLLGAGFKASKEKLIPFLAIYPTCDLVLFDHSEPYTSGFFWNYLQKGWNILDVYFVQAQGDIRAIVKYLRGLEKDGVSKYDFVGAAGLCYSGTVFLGAQASSAERLLDKIIVDSSFHSLASMARAVFSDPKLCCNHRTGGAPVYVKWPLSSMPVQLFVKLLGFMVLSSKFSELITARFANQMHNGIPTPLLLMHGKRDKLIPVETLGRVYAVSPKENTCAVAFPAYHVRLHLEDQKMLYALLVNLFIRSASMAEFIHAIKADDVESAAAGKERKPLQVMDEIDDPTTRLLPKHDER